MERFCVSTDSGCDLPADYCKKRDISAYHMKYVIDGEELSDVMMPEDCREFYEKMRKGAVPKTSQMTPYEFVAYWTELWQKYKLPIVHIAMGSGISGTYSNSTMAKKIFSEKNQDASIFLVDSTLASIGYGMLAINAADMRDDGKTAGECAEWLENNKIFINTYYTTDDLKYLYRSGRVSKTGAILGTALNINPILNLDRDGHLIVREKARGRKKAIQRIYDIIEKLVVDPQNQTVYICHSDCSEEAASFSENLIARFD
ncbi:MAG: DegV family protein, partial [Actinomycetota bacterium]|nr:DegV family protein [Actinomycetota bacterium]